VSGFVTSYIFVTLAEMGDKTQLLAMAFAAKYNAAKVLSGVLIATVLNHAAAVAAGRLLSAVIPLRAVYLLAALSFVIFGLWTIKGDSLSGEADKPSRYGPVLTVAAAFFLAEMGDKTQLATVSLAAQYPNALAVLSGTTLGMLTADAAGICIGIIMRRHLPQRTIKWLSAAVFIFFGLSGIFRETASWAGVFYAGAVTASIALLTAFTAYMMLRGTKGYIKKFDNTGQGEYK